MSVNRRAILSSSLALLGLGCRSARRSSAPTEYLDLRNVVTVSSESVREPWDNASFDAWLPTPDGEKLLRGILVRTAPGDASGLRAFCTICPHEVCRVDFVKEPARIRVDSGDVPDHPMFVCPCHFSVFDPLAEGASISGPAHRGLYAFALESTNATIHIAHVEAAVLAIFG